MTTVSKKLDGIIRQVGGPNSEEYRNLRRTIEQSPFLLNQLETAVAQKHLKKFDFLPADKSAGAEYDRFTQTIHLKKENLKNSSNHYQLAFILGHEVQHAINRNFVEKHTAQFHHDSYQVLLNGPGQTHDFTSALSKMKSVNRQNEASAHIAGWNSLVSYVHQTNPHATLKDIYETHAGYPEDFIIKNSKTTPATYSLKPGFSVKADLTMHLSPNIEAAGRHFFDKSSQLTRLGHHHNSDYSNYYGSDAVSYICQLESINPGWAGKVTMDMHRLKYVENLLEENGINLGEGATSATRCAYYDKHSPNTVRYFDHTVGTHTYVPLPEAHSPALPLPELPSMPHSGKTASQADTPPGFVPSGDAQFDAMVIAAMRQDQNALGQTLQSLAASPFGQAFHNEIRNEVQAMDMQKTQEQQQTQAAQQPTQQPEPIQHTGPVMRR